jgi:hypothetical protein
MRVGETPGSIDAQRGKRRGHILFGGHVRPPYGGGNLQTARVVSEKHPSRPGLTLPHTSQRPWVRWQKLKTTMSVPFAE